MAMIEIVEVGWATTVQDGGRPGFAASGVSPSGACDQAGLALANRLVGNPPRTAALETAGGLRIQAVDDIIAVGGDYGPVAVRAGDEWVVPHDPDRRWTYVAVRGGLDIEPVLGSVSQDTLSAIGPPPLGNGARLRIGADPGMPMLVDHGVRPPHRSARIRIWPGPRADWFGGDVVGRLCAEEWTIAAGSRIGARLTGEPIERRHAGELPSEGLVTGAIQIPHDGLPVVMLADHPTTGGYPVAAVVDPRDISAVAQAPDGTVIRFVSM
jgi:biotin-dependent carboxylase-like uncharacterized protein